MRQGYSRDTSIALITVMYIVAVAAGVWVFGMLSPLVHWIWALLVADIVATVIIWGFGIVYNNVSIYDPYWSVIPPVVLTCWAFFKGSWGLPVILLFVAVWFWSIRLTWNWAYTFKGLGHEDWRYTRYRQTLSPVLFHITNFFGLNMMPTLLVFACMVPGLLLIDSGSGSWLVLPGFVMCIAAATIQIVSDTQIHRFRESNPGLPCDIGLWKHGRHPNYFGEILFWWGIWVMYASYAGIDLLVFSPIAMTCLFLFISIPIMEKRQLANKPGYDLYKKSTRILI